MPPLFEDDPSPSISSPSEESALRRIGFTLTPEDLVAAYKLQHYARLWSWQSLVSGLVAFAILAVFVILAMPEAPSGSIVAVFGCGLFGGIAVPLAIIRWHVPAVARRIYGQQRSLHGTIIFEWDRQEIRTATDHGNARIPWANYIRWRDDRVIVLLYQSDAIFQMLPKRVLSPSQIHDIKALAAEAGIKGARTPTT